MVSYVTLSLAIFAMHSIDSVQEHLQLQVHVDVGRGVLQGINNGLVDVLGTRSDTLILGMLWASVGLMVYIMTKSLVSMIGELHQDIEARHYVWARGTNRNEPLEGFVERFVMRLAAFIVLWFYIIYVVSYATAWQMSRAMGWQQGLADNGVLRFTFLLITSCLIWHGLTVILRFLMLRPRLLG
jgi:hypothetical protein